MATLPYFVFSPNTIISLIGLARGPDPTVATPAEDWRTATVDVIIPALNEEHAIAACLASVLRQTMQPRRIMLVDDGSTDRTVEIAEKFCRIRGAELTVIRRRSPIGKTPTIKRQARELDSDVEFILDGDTVLDSDNYIERSVQELYKAVGIASACGTIMPLRTKDRRRFDSHPELQAFHDVEPTAQLARPRPLLRRIASGITNMYREVLYMFLQRFVYVGQMTAFGSITNPVGCAVAYRRRYVKDLFDKYTPIFGDDLTNSEDIFIGFALLNEGYRNIQLTDVYARTVEPEVQQSAQAALPVVVFITPVLLLLRRSAPQRATRNLELDQSRRGHVRRELPEGRDADRASRRGRKAEAACGGDGGAGALRWQAWRPARSHHRACRGRSCCARQPHRRSRRPPAGHLSPRAQASSGAALPSRIGSPSVSRIRAGSGALSAGCSSRSSRSS